MAAGLSAIRKKLQAQNKDFKLLGLQAPVVAALRDVGYFTNGKARPTMIPLRLFDGGQGRAFASYSQQHITIRGLPEMSRDVQSKIFEGIDELFQNFAIHAESPLGLYACGQLYPRRNALEFAMADMGLGIPAVVENKRRLGLSGPQAIEWAISDRNTTRSLDVPGGLGLKIIRDFIAMNGGSLYIASGDGFWSSSSEGAVRKSFEYNFPGTVVTLKFNTADTNSYYMSEEIDPDEIL